MSSSTVSRSIETKQTEQAVKFTENQQTSNLKSSKQSNGKSATNNTTQNTIQESKNIDYSTPNLANSGSIFDFAILERQLSQCYNKLDISFPFDEVLEVFKYFIAKHKKHCGFEHPRISTNALINMLEGISYVYTDMHEQMETDVENYTDMIDFYWEQALKQNFKGNDRSTINYSIMHFMSEGIKANCFYKTCF